MTIGFPCHLAKLPPKQKAFAPFSRYELCTYVHRSIPIMELWFMANRKRGYNLQFLDSLLFTFIDKIT